MKIAIYSRKSKFTGKGESIENQIEMCKNYIYKNINNINDNQIIIFEDEGYSGKNMNRPEFQKMINEIKNKKINCIICYKLDRISRNISDFSQLIEFLDKNNTMFISIKENFDTSSPIGKAMMYITSVFSQMERETISERIRDNMITTAQSGKWLGGTFPLGFTSPKNSLCLTPNENEIELVKKIYSIFLETKSLNQVRIFLSDNNIKTRNNIPYTIGAIKNIIQNPVYCTVDIKSKEYFINLGCNVYINDINLNSKLGFISYNKTCPNSSKDNNRKKNNFNNWIIACGKHKGIIKSYEWIKAQELLEINKNKYTRKPRNSIAILDGLLYCKCGSYMRPKIYRYKNNTKFIYQCELREKSKQQKCNNKGIQGNTLDEIVCSKILNYHQIDSSILNQINSLKSNYTIQGETEKFLNKELHKKQTSIKNLISSLCNQNDEIFINYVKSQILEIDKECKKIKEKLNNIKLSKENISFPVNLKELINFEKGFEYLSVEEKRIVLKIIIKKIIWNGKNADIYLK